MSNRKNLRSARAYRSPKGGWKLEVTFNNGQKDKLGVNYTILDHVAIEIGNTNLKKFTVKV